MRRQLVPALRMVAVLTVLCGLVYPLAMTGVAQALFADKADGSLIERDGEVVGLVAGRPGVHRPRVLPHPSVGGRRAGVGIARAGPTRTATRSATRTRPTRPTCRRGQRRVEPGADQRGPARRHRGAHRRLPRDQRPGRRRAGADRRRHASASGVDPHISRRQRPPPGPRVARRARPVRRTRCSRSSTTTPTAGRSGSWARRASTSSS